jgi:tetratricopeptide (TPR) repeat protein
VTRAVLIASLLFAPMGAHAQSDAERWARSYAAEAGGDYAAALSEHLQISGPTRRGYLFHLRHGWLLYATERFEEALAPYRRAAESQPNAVEARLGLMLPLMALRRWREVVAVARRIHEVDRHNVTARRRLALALFSLGRFDDALVEYERVLALWPGDLEMQAGVGWSQLRLGRSREAAQTFAAVLAVSPHYASAIEGARLANGSAH